MQRNALAQINLKALQDNLLTVRKHAPDSKIMCAVKANAYGHGLVEVAKALNIADGFAVAHLSEATELRYNGITQTILVLQGPQYQQDIPLFEQNNITAVIHHHSQVPLLKDANINIWLKVNTGMNRLGFLPEDIDAVIDTINTYKNINIKGLFTHMADADFADSRDTSQQQLSLLHKVNHHGYPLTIANSASLLHWPESQQAWVRPGIMLYGVNPFVNKSHAYNLKPVMQLSAPIIAINRCAKGEKVGYAGEWQAQRDSKIAVISIGYGDGYPRHAKNNTPVLIAGSFYPLVGRVSMDLITVDITDNDTIQMGERAILWGDETFNGKKVSLPVEKIAQCADTIAYELLCSVFGRVNYHYIN